MVFYNQKNTKKESPGGNLIGISTKILPLVYIMLLLAILTSCKKEKVVPPPVVEILAPAKNETVLLPNEVNLHLRVSSEKNIKFIEVSFVNYDQVKLFDPRAYYFDSTFVEIDEKIDLDILPQGFFSPYFIHVTVIGGAGTHTYFQEIKFLNPEVKFKGLYVSTRSSINRTQVYFYDPSLTETLFASADGEYVASTTAEYKDRFYLITSNPSRLLAYAHDDKELVWEKTPELPEPEFTTLRYTNFNLFTATRNGRLKSYHPLTGNQDVVTSVLHDSIPLLLDATGDHILGEFLAKNTNSNSLVLFYRRTGTIVHKRPLNFSVAGIYVGKYGFNFVIFGNENQTSLAGTYHPLGNFINDEKIIEEGLIAQVERYSPDKFFLQIGNGIYLYDYNSGVNKLIRAFPEEVTGFGFDPVHSILYVAFSQQVEAYSYPDNDLAAKFDVPYPIVGLDLMIGY